MTNMTTHKNQVGQDGTGINGGEFARKTQSDADEATIPAGGVEQELAALSARVDAVEGELVDAAAAAITAIVLDRYPRATAITVTDTSDEDEERYLTLTSVLEGDRALWDSTLWSNHDASDEVFGDAVNAWAPTLGRDINRLNRSKSGRGYALTLSGDAGEDALAAAREKTAALQDLADNGLVRMGALAREAVAARVKEYHPTAAAVFLININDEDGYPFLNLSTVEDEHGNIIYDAESDEDDEFNEYVNEFAVACDRDLDALDNVDDGWSFEGLWRLAF